LRDARYADDWLLGFSGPRHEAEAITRQIGTLLREHLKLALSDAKTLIAHARTQAARFLGSEIAGLNNNQKLDGRGHRSIHGPIGLRVPRDVIQCQRAPDLRQGKAIHRPELRNDSACSIVVQYQQEYRGLVESSRLASNLHQRNRLQWTMERSLVQPLAHKRRMSVSEVSRRYQTPRQTDQGPRVGLQGTVERQEGKRPPVARWGGLSVSRNTKASLHDSPLRICGPRTELDVRLQADTGELCGAEEAVEVHHVRALKALRRKGRAERPFWVQVMAARQRKTLVACRPCHEAIPRGALIQKHTATGKTLESRVLRKASARFGGGRMEKYPQRQLASRLSYFIITGVSQALLANEVRPLAAQCLRERGLALAPEKTSITHIADGFDFLGHTIRKYQGYLRITPAQQRGHTFLTKVRQLIRHHTSPPAGE
jgi:hypothetical protein